MNSRSAAVGALLFLLGTADAQAWMTKALKDHQGIEKELDDINQQSQSSLAASKALQAFNSTIYTLRTAVVAAMVGQAATANCSVKFPALYQQDDPSAAKSAQARSRAQAEPLEKTGKLLQDGKAGVEREAVPLADYLRDVDEKARAKIGGAGTPSGRRADSLIRHLNEAAESGLKANRQGKQSQKDSETTAQAALDAAKKVSDAATKNDEISGQLTKICDSIKALPKDPASLPASMIAAVAMAAKAPPLHGTGSGPLAEAAAAVASAQQALKTAKKSRLGFFKVIPGDDAPREPRLEYATKANDIRNRLDAKMKEAQ